MSDAGTPNPFPTPPSIEASVQEHLNVVHELREFRTELEQQRADVRSMLDVQQATAKVIASLAANLGRLADDRTVDSLTLQRIERKFDQLLVEMKKGKPA